MINELIETNKRKVEEEEKEEEERRKEKRKREQMLKDMEGVGKRDHQNSPEENKI